MFHFRLTSAEGKNDESSPRRIPDETILGAEISSEITQCSGTIQEHEDTLVCKTVAVVDIESRSQK